MHPTFCTISPAPPSFFLNNQLIIITSHRLGGSSLNLEKGDCFCHFPWQPAWYPPTLNLLFLLFYVHVYCLPPSRTVRSGTLLICRSLSLPRVLQDQMQKLKPTVEEMLLLSSTFSILIPVMHDFWFLCIYFEGGHMTDSLPSKCFSV